MIVIYLAEYLKVRDNLVTKTAVYSMNFLSILDFRQSQGYSPLATTEPARTSSLSRIILHTLHTTHYTHIMHYTPPCVSRSEVLHWPVHCQGYAHRTCSRCQWPSSDHHMAVLEYPGFHAISRGTMSLEQLLPLFFIFHKQTKISVLLPKFDHYAHKCPFQTVWDNWSELTK
jgi:hypothetical protein